MGLRDFIKPKQSDTNEELIEKAVSVYERNELLYKGKSMNWLLRVTADEVGIKKDELIDILEKFYGDDE